jgi:hypothetical protein
MMAELIGTNNVGLEVWEIEEGGQRPMILGDGSGRIPCRVCGEVQTPGRVRLNLFVLAGVEWGVLFCPKCEQAHCILRVQLSQRTMIDEAGIQPVDPIMSQIEKQRMIDKMVEGKVKVDVKGKGVGGRKLGIVGHNPTITAPPPRPPKDEEEPEPDA